MPGDLSRILRKFPELLPGMPREICREFWGYTRESLGSCPGNPCQDLGKADWLPLGNSAIFLGASLVSLEKACSTLGKTSWEISAKTPRGSGQFPGIAFVFSWGVPGASREFSQAFTGNFSENLWEILGKRPGVHPNISLGNHRESMQICRAFAGTFLGNLWGILGVHPSISRDKSLGAFPRTPCQHLFLARYPEDFL